MAKGGETKWMPCGVRRKEQVLVLSSLGGITVLVVMVLLLEDVVIVATGKLDNCTE